VHRFQTIIGLLFLERHWNLNLFWRPLVLQSRSSRQIRQTKGQRKLQKTGKRFTYTPVCDMQIYNSDPIIRTVAILRCCVHPTTSRMMRSSQKRITAQRVKRIRRLSDIIALSLHVNATKTTFNIRKSLFSAHPENTRYLACTAVYDDQRYLLKEHTKRNVSL